MNADNLARMPPPKHAVKIMNDKTKLYALIELRRELFLKERASLWITCLVRSAKTDELSQVLER